MIYCKKLELILPDVDLSKIKGGSLYEGYGETFRSWNILDLDYFQEIISSVVRFNIKPTICTYTEISGQGAAPHSERLQTVLNYYIDTGRCTTFFWKLKNLKSSVETLSMLDDAGNWTDSQIRSYNYDELEYADKFIAKPNEAWLLNTGSIHSLIKPIVKDTRKFFRMGWNDYTVEEVYNSIEIL